MLTVAVAVNSSVIPVVGGVPAKSNAEELLAPAEPTLSLAVETVAGAVDQDEPLKDSVAVEFPGGASPAYAKAEVLVPDPPKAVLAVFKDAPVVQLLPL